ncbi:MAG: tRNA pseudouridine(38-40) synthase TruA [Firmicutes bacterium HGW-Firmicutes-1]|jgi:tRNA pseudouridine38-40 synthase|nr:MAG: tRNA pseudouridine(38-40) synthase TruA [Firmicutes bacterium HGW-Firmicutes-1]
MNKIFKIIIAYEGTNYCGWQKQIGHKTVEGELLKACNRIFKESFVLKGSSRTDSGVHAFGQAASIEVKTKLTPYKICRALNCYLPEDIVVQSAEEMDFDFHPRYCAKEKTYIYKIYNSKIPLPQERLYSYFYHKPLDIERMKEASKYFLGEHDFVAFSAVGGSVKTSVRTLYRCDIVKKGNLVEIIVTGNSFLYNMVRIIVGTLIEVGIGNIEPEEICDIIESKDRLKPGKKSPAKGLTLVEIKY